jgi:hypothetical protein
MEVNLPSRMEELEAVAEGLLETKGIVDAGFCAELIYLYEHSEFVYSVLSKHCSVPFPTTFRASRRETNDVKLTRNEAAHTIDSFEL